MTNATYCVYSHTNKINGKKYFGITNRTPETRWGLKGAGYLKHDAKGQFQHPAFANAIVQYGWDGFYHDVLFRGLTAEEAKEKEIELIKAYKTNVCAYGNRYGYNCTNGGDGHTGGKVLSGKAHPMYGKHHSAESCKKMSLSKTGAGNNQYGKRGTAASFYGHKHTEEYKQRMREIHLGAKHPLAQAVICVETGEWYDTVQAAADAVGAYRANVSACCRGKKHTAGGFHWKYAV